MIPLFPLGTVLFPGAPLPLHVFEPRYRALVHDLKASPQPWSFGIIAIREGHEVGTDSVKSLHDVGCTAVIRQLEELPDGRFAMVLVGGNRFRVVALDESRPYLRAEVEFVEEPSPPRVPDGLVSTVRERFTDYCGALGTPEISQTLPSDTSMLSYVVATTMMVPLGERQSLLEATNTGERLQSEAGLLSRELALIRTGTMPVNQPRLPPHSQN